MEKLYWILFIGGVWSLQTYLGMRQMKNFNNELQSLYKSGKVVIGKYKGMFFKGCIIVFSLEKNNRIKSGRIMEGFTVFNKMKNFDILNGLSLDEAHSIVDNLKIDYSRKKALKNLFTQ